MAVQQRAGVSEAELQQRLLDGDEQALSDCYARFGTLVFTVAFRTTGNRAAAEDISQEVFLSCWARPDKLYLKRGTMGAWLGRVSHNRAVDWNRSEAVRCRRTQQEDMTLGPVDPRDAAEAAGVAEKVRVVLDDLPERQRTPIRLAYFGDMTYRRVATELGVAEGTVKARIRAGLRRMGTALA